MNKPDADFLPCGIEVSSKTLLVALGSKALRTFPNTSAGHQALLRCLERAGNRVRLCLEATGRYGLDLALTLHEARLPVMVANPRAVRHFASALMERSKTDPLDARVLAEYAARMPFQNWQPPSPTALKLVAVARHLQALTKMITAEKNRLHAASLSQALPGYLRLEITRHLRTLEQSVQRLTAAAGEFIADDAELVDATNSCSPFPASVPPAPCTCWRSSLCSAPIWTSASGWW
jgi:transposase